jgi:hypothetical protein
VAATYLLVLQQLPATSMLESFSSANQVGIAQLAVQYCNVAVNTPAYQAALFPGVTFTASLYPAGAGQVTSLLAARVLGTNVTTQPDASSVTGELNSMITTLCTPACSTQARVLAVTSAACAAAFGSADMLIQ